MTQKPDFSSGPDDLFQFNHPSFESHGHAVFRTGLVFTVAINKKSAASFKTFCMKTAQFGDLVWSETTVALKQTYRLRKAFYLP